ncbi:MAG TPA: GNAT family N-acetyltransferase [Candidatus Elarobacter sp.]|nr:GNAT family N-acetyltransferase [Candidatus Elarobacter sp.]
MTDSYLPPRPATAADLDVLVRHRVRMFADMGVASDDGFAALTAASRAWLAGALADERYVGWLVARADAPEEIVAGSGMLLLDWPPGIHDVATTRGYILNVYTEPEHRGHGLATLLTHAAVGDARRRGIRVVTLHASDEGEPIYERLGFTPNNEMRLLL